MLLATSASEKIPTISVLLPVFNAELYVRKAVESVLEQSFADFELIVIDDGSQDSSPEIVAELAALDPRIIVFTRSNRGIVASLNEGIELSRGQWIARMDADDISFPDRFEKQLRYLQAHPEVDLVGCRAVVFRDNGETIGLLPFEASHESLCRQPWRNIPLPHPSWMGQRSWFLRHGYRFPAVERAEDQELLLRSSKDSRFACLDEVLLAYRQGPFQLRRTFIARRALLGAQLGLFIKRRELTNTILAFTSAVAKTAVDCVATLPGMQKLFFARMGGPVSKHVREQLASSLAQCRSHRI